MNKIPALLYLIFFIISTNINAQDNSSIKTDPFNLFYNHEFATYHDTRGIMNMFRAYWVIKLEDNGLLFCIRNIDLNNLEEKNYIVEIKMDSMGSVQIIDIAGYSNDDSPYFKQSYIDLLDFIDLMRNQPMMYEEDNILRDEWEDFTLLFSVNPMLPLFCFETIAFESDTKVIYRLLTAGRIDPNDMETFFTMRPTTEMELTGGLGDNIPDGIPMTGELYNYSVQLDSNWVSNSSLGFPGYWLQANNPRDSQIMMERSAWSDIVDSRVTDIDSFLRRTLYFQEEVYMLMESLDISWNGDRLEVYYEVFDSCFQITCHVQYYWLEGDYFYIQNFSCFKNIYEANIEYFQDILESITDME